MVTTVVAPGTDVETEVTVVRGWLVGVEVGTDVTVVARGWLVGTELTDVGTDVAVVARGVVDGTEGVVVDTGASTVTSGTDSGTKAGAGLLSTDWAPAMTTPPKASTAPAVRAVARMRLNMASL